MWRSTSMLVRPVSWSSGRRDNIILITIRAPKPAFSARLRYSESFLQFRECLLGESYVGRPHHPIRG